MQSIPQKFEAAAKGLIDAASVSVSVRRNGEQIDVPLAVFTGLGQDDKALPALTIAAVNGQEFPQGSGNFTLNITVMVASNADETDLLAHRQLCEDALAPLMDEDTAANLSAGGEDLGVMGISNRQSAERIEDRSWVTELQFDAYCCGLALS